MRRPRRWREVEGAGDHDSPETVLGADDVPREIEGGLADGVMR